MRRKHQARGVEIIGCRQLERECDRGGVDPVGEPVAKQDANGACAAKFWAKDNA
jgi:hypothetical protein